MKKKHSKRCILNSFKLFPRNKGLPFLTLARLSSWQYIRKNWWFYVENKIQMNSESRTEYWIVNIIKYKVNLIVSEVPTTARLRASILGPISADSCTASCLFSTFEQLIYTPIARKTVMKVKSTACSLFLVNFKNQGITSFSSHALILKIYVVYSHFLQAV